MPKKKDSGDIEGIKEGREDSKFLVYWEFVKVVVCGADRNI